MIYISRKEYFNAAHQLWNPKWTESQNKEAFGICANPNFHGHNFELIVTVAGKPDPDTAFVVDYKKLGDIIVSKVVTPLDHKNLNLDVPFLKGKMTSCEVLIVEIWKILAPEIKKLNPEAKLHKLRLDETRKNFVEYYGEV